jgi:DNA photolyase
LETAIVVFTRDLRLHDNPALYQACARARQVVPLFVHDPAINAPPNRARFLAESLADLRRQLHGRGADLVIRTGDPAAEVITLATQTAARAVYLADDVSRYAARRRRRLEHECARHRLDLTVTPGLTVVPPGELRPAGGGHYRVSPRTGGPGAPPDGAGPARCPASSPCPRSAAKAGSRRPARAPRRRWPRAVKLKAAAAVAAHASSRMSGSGGRTCTRWKISSSPLLRGTTASLRLRRRRARSLVM